MRFYKIVIGNSQDMSEIKDRSIDLTVTSPPYLNLVVFKNSVKGELSDIVDKGKLVDAEKEFFGGIRKNFSEVYRVTKVGGKFVLEVEDYPIGSEFYGYPREIFLAGKFVEAVESTGFYLISRWFWRKFETGAALQKFQYTMYANLTSSEPRAIANVAYCFVFKKFARDNVERKLDFTRDEWRNWSDGLWYIENPASTELESGQAIFPVELVKRFIKIYTNKGDTILDCFLGTGTTMKAAFELERSCVGYEIRPSMLNTIKAKVAFGQQPIYDEVSWEAIVK